MMGDTPLLAGVLIGLSVTVPVGPMGILCIQRTLVGGMAFGISTGLGATVMQICYATMFLLGLHEIGPDLAIAMRTFNVGGGLLLLWFGVRLSRRRVRLRASRRRPASLLFASTSAMALNACNPMLVLLLAGTVTSIAGPDAAQGRDAARLLLGLAAGSAGWWVALSGMVATLRNRLHPWMLGTLNRLSAASLFGFGALAIGRALWP